MDSRDCTPGSLLVRTEWYTRYLRVETDYMSDQLLEVGNGDVVMILRFSDEDCTSNTLVLHHSGVVGWISFYSEEWRKLNRP